MTHANKKIQNLDEQIILLPSQRSWVGMLRTTLDYLDQTGPPAIIIEVFPRNESDGTPLSKFHCKRIPSNGEAAGHPWLLLLAWKNGIFCYYFKVFDSGYLLSQHSIPLLSAGTTLGPPFSSGRCLAREEVLMRVVILWVIGFNGAVHWNLHWTCPDVTLTRLAFVTSPISIITPCTPQKFLYTIERGPAKVFQIGPCTC